MPIISLEFADPQYEPSFRAFRNYLEDLAGKLGGAYGLAESLVSGVHDGVSAHPVLRRVQRRRVAPKRADALDKALRKSWGHLVRGWREVEDDQFDREANAFLATFAYYAVYHAIRAFALASSQEVKPDHRATLNLISKEVTQRKLLPHPWSVACSGCPQLGTVCWHGLASDPEEVHVLSRPDPETSDARVAMFLRTTREKELKRRFVEERGRSISAGRSRRNLSRKDKTRLASGLLPTTLFDVFWRLRKKSSYEDADVFVLGAAGDTDARRFGESLVIVTDATVAALESAVAAYVGPKRLAYAAAEYKRRKGAGDNSPLGRRAASWEKRAARLEIASV
jgi:hypothetical protein